MEMITASAMVGIEQDEGADESCLTMNTLWQIPLVLQKERFICTDEWGITWKASKGKDSFKSVVHPMEELEIHNLFEYAMPHLINMSVYNDMAVKIKALSKEMGEPITVNCNRQNGTGYRLAQALLGRDELFVRMITDGEFVRELLDRITCYQMLQWSTVFEKAGEYIKCVRFEDDLGYQKSRTISPEVFHKLLCPAQKTLVRHIKALKPSVKVIYRCDGALHRCFSDFVDIGYDVWEPTKLDSEIASELMRLQCEFGRWLKISKIQDFSQYA